MPVHRQRCRLLALESEDTFRLPELQDQHHAADAAQRAQDVRQFGPHVVRNVELNAREGHAADDHRRQDLHRLFPSNHQQEQIHRDDDGDHGAETSNHRAQCQDGQAGDPGQRRHRNADRSERNRRGVGQQTNPCGVERREPQACQHRARDRHRRTEPGCAFDERSERKRDEERLQPAIVRQAAYGVFDDFEFAGVHGQPIQHDRREDDPGNREQAVSCAVQRGQHRQLHGHAGGDQRKHEGHSQRGERRHPGWFALHTQHEKQHENRYRGHCRRQAQTAAHGLIILLPHSSPQST